MAGYLEETSGLAEGMAAMRAGADAVINRLPVGAASAGGMLSQARKPSASKQSAI